MKFISPVELSYFEFVYFLLITLKEIFIKKETQIRINSVVL